MSPIFGFKFPKIKFDKRLIPIAQVMTKVGANFMNDNRLKKLIKGLYGKDLPELKVYINTTPFSSWNAKEKYLYLSYTRNDATKFFSTICHESNHLMYDLTFGTEKYQDTVIKETLTVLNNAFGVEDKGWQNFSQQRKAVLDFYIKNKDLKKTVNFAKDICK